MAKKAQSTKAEKKEKVAKTPRQIKSKKNIFLNNFFRRKESQER